MGNGGNGNLLLKDLCQDYCLQKATGGPGLRWSLLGTHRQVWLSLLWGHCFFLLGPGVHKVLVVPSKSLFLWGLSILLLTPQVGISIVDPRTFATVQELLWYNCSPGCESPAWWLYS